MTDENENYLQIADEDKSKLEQFIEIEYTGKSKFKDFEENMKKLTVSEFRTWLNGVMEFQDDNWTPNQTQWKRILNKIEQLEEASVVSTTNLHPNKEIESKPIPMNNRISNEQTQPKEVPPAPKIENSTVKSLEEKQLQFKSNNQNPVIQSKSPSVSIEGDQKIINTGELHKRNPIDTSDGNYVSEFI